MTRTQPPSLPLGDLRPIMEEHRKIAGGRTDPTPSPGSPIETRAIPPVRLHGALSSNRLDMEATIEPLSQSARSHVLPQVEPATAVARGVVEDLAREALSHRAVHHPYLEAMSAGQLPDLRWALADFARHYPGYSAHFPRYLRTVIARLTRSDHRATLLENLAEESGQYQAHELGVLSNLGIEPGWIMGVPHPHLFERFRVALQVHGTGADTQEHPKVRRWRERFLAVLREGSPAEAVGALGLGTENLVRALYVPFIAAIKHLGNIEPRASVFFPLHTTVDDHHNEALLQIATELAIDETARIDLERGMHKALALRESFWSWLHERALNPGPHHHD